MQLEEIFHSGMNEEIVFQVTEAQTAATVGSGSLRVLATPVMIGIMESVCHRLLARHLPQGFSSVGVHVDVRHLAPTPAGATVRVRGEILSVSGLSVLFAVSAFDDREQCGSGEHERVVIEAERFLKRVSRKRAELGLDSQEPSTAHG
jgi:predicted thioesterase